VPNPFAAHFRCVAVTGLRLADSPIRVADRFPGLLSQDLAC